MTDTILAATRWERARERAAAKAVRLQVVEPRSHYRAPSQSQDDTDYQLIRGRTGWTCTCPGYLHTSACKHLGALQIRAEREGWSFDGKPAPSTDDDNRALALKLMRGPR